MYFKSLIMSSRGLPLNPVWRKRRDFLQRKPAALPAQPILKGLNSAESESAALFSSHILPFPDEAAPPKTYPLTPKQRTKLYKSSLIIPAR